MEEFTGCPAKALGLSLPVQRRLQHWSHAGGGQWVVRQLERQAEDPWLVTTSRRCDALINCIMIIRGLVMDRFFQAELIN